jgi:hypothetical protein
MKAGARRPWPFHDLPYSNIYFLSLCESMDPNSFICAICDICG